MMLRTIPVLVVIALCLGLGGAVVVQRHQLAAVRASRAVLALAIVNAAAELDTTRSIATMNQKVAARLGDSLGLVEKRVRQVTQRSDALDRALGRERRAVYTMGVVIDSLRQSATATAVATNDGASADVRRARFDIRQAPYSVAAHVEIPKPPGTARIAFHVSLDTINVGARVTCAATDEQGIRAASIVASIAGLGQAAVRASRAIPGRVPEGSHPARGNAPPHVQAAVDRNWACGGLGWLDRVGVVRGRGDHLGLAGGATSPE